MGRQLIAGDSHVVDEFEVVDDCHDDVGLVD
jgi:hypothetical protein